jgi:hypothetical protein
MPFLPPQSGSDPQIADDCEGNHAACSSSALRARSKNFFVLGQSQADVTEASGGIWKPLHYDWSDPDCVVLMTTD